MLLVAIVVFCLATSQDENDMFHQVPDDSVKSTLKRWRTVCLLILLKALLNNHDLDSSYIK